MGRTKDMRVDENVMEQEYERCGLELDDALLRAEAAIQVCTRTGYYGEYLRELRKRAGMEGRRAF